MFCFVFNVCVLLLLNLFVRCGCGLLCDVVRFVVLILFVLVYLCVVLWFRNVFVC